jgi:hypothetical protein
VETALGGCFGISFLTIRGAGLVMPGVTANAAAGAVEAPVLCIATAAVGAGGGCSGFSSSRFVGGCTTTGVVDAVRCQRESVKRKF